jgi:uncharacterized membrane protein
MTVFTHSLFYLTLALLAAALLAIARARRLRWRPAWALRLAFAALVLAAALLPPTTATGDTPPRREVLIIDQSDSLSPEARGLARAQARQWLAGGENRLLILAGAAALPVSGEDWGSVDGRASDLAGALKLADQLIGSQPGRITIATDGIASDPLAWQSALAASPHPLRLIPLAAETFPTDSFTGALHLPASMWENSPYTAVLPVFLQQDADVTIRLTVDGVALIDETIPLPAGPNLIPFTLHTGGSGIVALAAAAATEGDPRPENNAAYASLRVFPAPAVLIVSEDAGISTAFAAALRNTGLSADVTRPADLPASLGELDAYQVILLHNFLANKLDEAQMTTLKSYVQQLGRGLVFIGGRNAYTLGGYKDTLLEPILPVRLEPPPRDEKSPLTLLLVIDRSASMAPQRTPNNQRPITLAREAALRAIETLSPGDTVGLLAYNVNTQWILPLQPAGEGSAAQNAKDALTSLNASGGTAIFNALNTAVTALLENPTTDTRHIVLLSDGNDDTPLEEYLALAAFAHEQGITISTIALGAEAGQQLMALIAQAGGGRYYPVLQAADLPKILIDESLAARGENVHEGETRAVPGEAGHPVLSGFSPAELPALNGYNALESRAGEGAEDILLTAGFEDPLLSVWQVGLGRVAAWMGDLGEEWAAGWAGWDRWGLMWSQVIRYTLPDPALGPAQVQVEVGIASLTVRAQIASAGGVPRNGLALKFSFAGGDGVIRSAAMPQTAPGLYELTMPRPAEGVYRGVVQYPDENGAPLEIAAPLVINYPPEWQPALGEPAPFAGEVITWDQLVPPEGVAPPRELSQNQVVGRIISALLVLWLGEIAVRRKFMPWR